MRSINITNARKNLYKLVEKLSETQEPIHITGKNKSAVLVAEEDLRSIEETLYLLSLPDMRVSIIKGMKEPIRKSSIKIDGEDRLHFTWKAQKDAMSRQGRNVTQFGKVEMSPSNDLSSLLTAGEPRKLARGHRQEMTFVCPFDIFAAFV
jgi:prevent-host-death family protein